jgi:hypothetical protein
MSSLEPEVLTLDPSKAPERIGQGVRTRLRALAKLTDPVSLPTLLRRSERHGEQRGSTSKERAAVYHSIT